MAIDHVGASVNPCRMFLGLGGLAEVFLKVSKNILFAKKRRCIGKEQRNLKIKKK